MRKSSGRKPASRARKTTGKPMAGKLWAGRFRENTDAFVEQFTASVDFDRRLYRHDIQGSIAHARMLTKAGVLTPSELKAIHSGLKAIELEIDQGKFPWSVQHEDVHMNIESALIARIGDAGKKLHTGRSRNDQVATDLRLYLRDEIDGIREQLRLARLALLDRAETETATVMPGFTHLQVAQPVSFAHHLMAWFEMLDRDDERLRDCRQRLNRCPLGAAALAGTTYPIDRQFTARELGFDKPCANSLDAVSDRDFAIEFVSCAALVMAHLSRIAEELVLWSSSLVNFIRLPDRYCTGSSIMPQKKNPDVPELLRGKTGRVYGHLMALLTLVKSQPLAYNKDNQEDKEPVFDAVDTVKASLQALTGMIPALEPNRDVMRAAALQGYATATDLADYLVRRGIPFRDAHEAVGKAVALGVESGRDLSELTLGELQSFSPTIGKDVFKYLTLEGSMAARKHSGGTAPQQVHKAIQAARVCLQRRQDGKA